LGGGQSKDFHSEEPPPSKKGSKQALAESQTAEDKGVEKGMNERKSLRKGALMAQ